MNKNKIIIISGPTASYKTSLSIEIAKHFLNTQEIEIINFDSLYFYKELNIGSAKPKMEERQGIKHHLIDITSISHIINAHDYVKLASPLLDQLLSKGITPILVGGSGFYLRALINGMYHDEGEKKCDVKEGEKILHSEGIEEIRRRLKDVDLESFNSLHPNDHYRNVRALQYYLNNLRPMSEVKKSKPSPYQLHRAGLTFLHLYLDLPKIEHEKIIRERTQSMLDQGLICEIKSLLNNGFTGNERPLFSVGNKEALEFIKGEIKNEEELAKKISVATRQLAKAQRTFLKKIVPKNTYHPLNDKDKIFDDVEFFLKD